MENSQWENFVLGRGCPFDQPRADSNEHWDLVQQLTASSLYLAANQAYRGQCLLVLDARHATRPSDLSAAEWGAFCADLHAAAAAIEHAVRPDHMNVAALGNVIPHLHWHIIPRYRDDPRWGAPVWPTSPADMPDVRLPDADRTELLLRIRGALAV